MEGHASFSDTGYWSTANNNEGQSYSPLTSWKGTCQADEDGTPYPCKYVVTWHTTCECSLPYKPSLRFCALLSSPFAAYICASRVSELYRVGSS